MCKFYLQLPNWPDFSHCRFLFQVGPSLQRSTSPPITFSGTICAPQIQTVTFQALIYTHWVPVVFHNLPIISIFSISLICLVSWLTTLLPTLDTRVVGLTINSMVDIAHCSFSKNINLQVTPLAKPDSTNTVDPPSTCTICIKQICWLLNRKGKSDSNLSIPLYPPSFFKPIGITFIFIETVLYSDVRLRRPF